MTGIVIKDMSGMYYTGIGKQASAWDKQLRKAKIYTSYNMAMKACMASNFINRHPKLFAIQLVELGEYK